MQVLQVKNGLEGRMKRLTIKSRVTLWYTLFMTVLTAVVLFLLVFIGGKQINALVRAKLETVMADNMAEVEYDDGKIDIDDDLVTFWDGVYFILYDQEGNHLRGNLPKGVTAEETPVFRDDQMQEAVIGSTRWILLDSYVPLRGETGVWMRGMISGSETETGLSVVLSLARWALPLFVVLIALGGYYIMCRAFSPVEQICRTVEEITDGDDLSRRIGLGKGRDELHQLADTFDRMLDRIEDAFEREKQFTSDASHELRTPISVIVTQAEYALRHDDPSGDLRERLQIILKHSQKMSGMLSQLLMLARADQGRAEIQKETVDLGELAEIVAEELREQAKDRGIQIHTGCQPGLCMEGDETLLMRCLINLLQNAISYGKEGGSVWVSLVGREDMIQGYIRDDGIGIPPEHLPKIWERFYQVDPGRSARENGSSGLGLSMVKWIVEAHGGSITVESREGEGTAFHFAFPWKRSA